MRRSWGITNQTIETVSIPKLPTTNVIEEFIIVPRYPPNKDPNGIAEAEMLEMSENVLAKNRCGIICCPTAAIVTSAAPNGTNANVKIIIDKMLDGTKTELIHKRALKKKENTTVLPNGNIFNKLDTKAPIKKPAENAARK